MLRSSLWKLSKMFGSFFLYFPPRSSLDAFQLGGWQSVISSDKCRLLWKALGWKVTSPGHKGHWDMMRTWFISVSSTYDSHTHTHMQQREDTRISFRYWSMPSGFSDFGASRMAYLLITPWRRRRRSEEDGETGWHCLLPEPLLTAGEGQPWQKVMEEADGREGEISGGTSPLQESRTASQKHSKRAGSSLG